VGKTRLTDQVAVRFTDGAWLAELAPVLDPAQVAAALGDTIAARCRRCPPMWPRWWPS
jgi:predicted ATPase